MKIDLKKLSRKELEKLSKDIDKALAKLRKEDIKKVRLEMEKLASAHGVKIEDVIGGKSTPKSSNRKSAKQPAPPKFANPNDKTQTWTGKGRRPVWYREAIAAGATPESMAV